MSRDKEEPKTSPAGDHYDLADPRHWQNNSKYVGPVDIYWIRDADGWHKLSNPVRCF